MPLNDPALNREQVHVSTPVPLLLAGSRVQNLMRGATPPAVGICSNIVSLVNSVPCPNLLTLAVSAAKNKPFTPLDILASWEESGKVILAAPVRNATYLGYRVQRGLLTALMRVGILTGPRERRDYRRCSLRG